MRLTEAMRSAILDAIQEVSDLRDDDDGNEALQIGVGLINTLLSNKKGHFPWHLITYRLVHCRDPADIFTGFHQGTVGSFFAKMREGDRPVHVLFAVELCEEDSRGLSTTFPDTAS